MGRFGVDGKERLMESFKNSQEDAGVGIKLEKVQRRREGMSKLWS